ncbi:hypothetical protein Daus18300_002100 [Diaporthe australafricana]|uniref:Uncharacterized protein n=1 Tax=Diaporthe australafricana TaxID=127596 RepID=A0ABR3XQB4_9PEZI
MPSTFNPSGSDDNCFWVTAAYLLGLQNVNQLPAPVVAEMHSSQGMYPHDGTSPEMENCLKQMDHPYRLETWALEDEGSEVLGGRHGGGNGDLVWRGEQFLFGEWNVAQIGIGYQTPSQECTCLDTNPPSYVCFQHNTTGTDKWLQVRGREKEVNGNWHDVIKRERSKVLCAFAFEGVHGNREAPGSKSSSPGFRPDEKTSQRKAKSGFWSKLCCCF